MDGFTTTKGEDGTVGSRCTTDVVKDSLMNADTIGGFLEQNRDKMVSTLPDFLAFQLYEKGLDVADVIRDSGQPKAYTYQIFNGEKHPSRDKLIAIAFGLHLDLENTQRMLKIGGCSELYPRIARDAVILFSIAHGKNISETDDALYENGFPTISRK